MKSTTKSTASTASTNAADIEQQASRIDATLVTAIEGVIAALGTLKAAVETAVLEYRKLGLSDEDIAARVKRLFKASSKANSVNKALRKAGVRQRGLRCDAGITKSGGIRFFLGVPSAKEDGEGDDEGGEADGEGEDCPDGEDCAKQLAKQALKLSGGDKDAAVAALKAALKLV